MTITLVTRNNLAGQPRLYLHAPYSPTVPAQCRTLGGRWSPATKEWEFDPRDQQRVRDLCLREYGVDPLAASPVVETRAVDINVSTLAPLGDALWIHGHQIARRMLRDSRVVLGPYVSIVSGGFTSSGGSFKYPALAPLPGTVVRVRDVPRSIAERMVADYPAAITIVTEDETVDVALTARQTTDHIVRLFKTLVPGDQIVVLAALEAVAPSPTPYPELTPPPLPPQEAPTPEPEPPTEQPTPSVEPLLPPTDLAVPAVARDLLEVVQSKTPASDLAW